MSESKDLCKLDRQLNLVKKIVIVDGMIGGGKNLLTSIVSSLPNVEMWIHRPQIEQICALFHLGHISLDASKTLINTWLEEEILNLNMSRNINFKPSDISSVFCDVKPSRYFKRLFQSPVKAKESIEKNMPILNIMTHVNTSYARPLFEALAERLTYIRVSRHPMTTNMLMHNKKWTERWGSDDRHSYILYKTFDGNGNLISLPFFAKDIEKLYLNSNTTDRSILLYDYWIRNGDTFIDNFKMSNKWDIIEIPYEKFVSNPHSYILKIAESLGVKPDNKTKKMMRKQKVPRSSLAEESNVGQLRKKSKSIKKNFSLHDVCAQGRAYAAETASPRALYILDQLSDHYEKRHQIKK